MPVVTLSWQEQLFAGQAGLMRRLSALSRQRCEPYGPPTVDLWGNDIESCGAEAAVAKLLDRYWLAVVARPQELPGDVGDVQVRSTQRADGRLIVYERDPDDARFVLVRGRFPTYDVVGWLRGRDAKRRHFYRVDVKHPAFFVPADALASMQILTDEVARTTPGWPLSPAAGA